MNGFPTVFPVVLRLENTRCLVVGGGRVAASKARSLLDAGAEVTVISPDFAADFDAIPVRKLKRPYERGDVRGYLVAIAATGSEEVNHLVFEDGEANGTLVNGADDVANCRFFMPSVLRRGVVTVAVSTGGASPYLASWLRRRLEEVIGPETGELAELLGSLRRKIRSEGRSTENLDWSSLPLDTLASLLATGRRTEADEVAARWLEQERSR